MKRRRRLFPRLRLKSWLWISIALAVMVLAVWWYFQPKTVEADYDPCRIDYGQVIGEWSGDSDKDWNREGKHYQARKFSLRAYAPNIFFPNAIEKQPTRISTGGDYACLEEFKEEIDTGDGRYRWNGARASDVRLGVPDETGDNIDGDLFGFQDWEAEDRDLTTDVYGAPADEAAVWVDDGGKASIDTGDNWQTLWCINATGCDDIADQAHGESAVAGNGYQYVSDACPEAVACGEEWYSQKPLDELSPSGSRNVDDFRLRLQAVSTYAPVVGAEMVLVFAYPSSPEVNMSLSSTNDRFMAGDDFDIKVHIERFGPSIDNARIEIDDSSQTVNVSEPSVDLSEQQLAELDRNDELELNLPASVNDNAEGGKCYNLELTLHAETGNGNDKDEKSFRYCVDTPVTTYTYSVDTRGSVDSDPGGFAAAAAETLADNRGWSRGSVGFKRVDSGGDFILWLAAADQMTGFSQGCSPEYSCRVGNNVIINDSRWQHATEPWNAAGGSLRDYRHMVINHEIGHFLGLGHYGCTGAGQPAPVMQQQSIDLEGCEFNPWPLDTEIDRL